ncbi:pyruvate carboxylase [Nocardia sp. NPDC004604]|uniref:pyruvate carboxylase n=1 Tax=Nocardia sp. NPDC004604 TaxID=3157013 RepID=UPI0033B13F02
MLTNLRNIVEAEYARTGKRRTITLTDGTLRDAHQCLWATRMRTEHMLPIAKKIEDAGFGGVEALAMVGFDVGVRFLNQDPFERVRLLRERIPTTPLRGAVRSNLLHGFYPQPDDLNELFIERMFVNGIGDFGFLDSLHSWDNVAPAIRVAQRLGAKVTIALVFNLAPGYDDDFYVRQAREIVDRFAPDTILFGDAGGSLTVERTRTLVPALRAAIGDTRLELGTHCLTATGPQVALEAAVYGADQILTAIDPLANGNSLPSAQMMARDLRALGFDVAVDDRLLDEVGDYLGKLADQLGYPVGVPAEYDPANYHTQYAGGALTNLEAQLQAAGIADKLPAVLEEIGRVRVELGSPVMATPFPAIVAAQAVMNVLNTERYAVVPDEVKKYVCGYFGALPLPIDDNVRDLVMNNGSRDISETPPVLDPILPRLRSRHGHLPPEQMMLRYMYDDQKIDALVPVEDTFSVEQSIVELVAGLGRMPGRHNVRLVAPGVELHAHG